MAVRCLGWYFKVSRGLGVAGCGLRVCGIAGLGGLWGVWSVSREREVSGGAGERFCQSCKADLRTR